MLTSSNSNGKGGGEMKEEHIVLLLENGLTAQGVAVTGDEERVYRSFMMGNPENFKVLRNVRVEPTGQTLTWLVVLKTHIVGLGHPPHVHRAIQESPVRRRTLRQRQNNTKKKQYTD
jgi:hypothetical protein